MEHMGLSMDLSDQDEYVTGRYIRRKFTVI